MHEAFQGEDEGILLSLSMFILQVLALAFVSWLFFRLVVPRSGAQHQESDHRRQSRRTGYSYEAVRGGDMRRANPTRFEVQPTNPVIRPAEATARHIRLPQELIDEIIDYLHDDKPSLRACALTSRNWVPRSRKHLHRTVVVRKNGPDPYTLNVSPGILASIRHVVIRGNLCGEVVHSALSGKREVERLDLENDPSKGSYTVTQAHLPSFPRLRTLTLRWVYFRTCQDMLEALSQLKRLSNLTLDLANFYFAFTGPDDVVPPVNLHIKTLRLRLRSMPVPINHTFRSQAILRASGRELKHLYIRVDSFAPEPSTRANQLIAVMESLDLSANTSLQSLELAFRWTAVHFYSRIRVSLSRKLAVTLLSQIHSRECRALTFHIHLSCLTEQASWLRCLDLRMLDHFAQPTVDIPMTQETQERTLACATNLKTLTLKLSLDTAASDHAFPRIESHVREQLPMLTARGILRIERCTESMDDCL